MTLTPKLCAVTSFSKRKSAVSGWLWKVYCILVSYLDLRMNCLCLLFSGMTLFLKTTSGEASSQLFSSFSSSACWRSPTVSDERYPDLLFSWTSCPSDFLRCKLSVRWVLCSHHGHRLRWQIACSASSELWPPLSLNVFQFFCCLMGITGRHCES